MESLTDADSVKGLGETTDVLNMVSRVGVTSDEKKGEESGSDF